jgi:VanZ family protein
MLARALFFVVLSTATFLFLWQFPSTGAQSIPHLDKLVHFGIFFVLALTFHRAFALSAKLSLLILVCYGFLIEIAQSYAPGRSADVYDWLADASGVVAYFILHHLLSKKPR